MVTFGVDAHKRTHTIVAVNDRGTPVGQTTVGTTSQDHLVLLRWAARFGAERRWAVEDCRHLSRRLERDLLAAGESIMRVPPKLMAHVRLTVRAVETGEVSHWLDNHEPSDLLDEVKRFARRRPGAFLALAAAAGVVAGRLTRGAVAANTSVDSDTDATPSRAYDSGDDDRGGYGAGAYGTGSYQSGYEPQYGEVAGETSYQGGGMPAPGQYAGTAAPGEYSTSGPAYPNVTPTTDEPYYPPPTEGEARQ